MKARRTQISTSAAASCALLHQSGKIDGVSATARFFLYRVSAIL